MSRYRETRRVHPLAPARHRSSEGIERERALLEDVARLADLRRSTPRALNIHQLREAVVRWVAGARAAERRDAGLLRLSLRRPAGRRSCSSTCASCRTRTSSPRCARRPGSTPRWRATCSSTRARRELLAQLSRLPRLPAPALRRRGQGVPDHRRSAAPAGGTARWRWSVPWPRPPGARSEVNVTHRDVAREGASVIGVLIVTHYRLAEEFLQALRLIVARRRRPRDRDRPEHGATRCAPRSTRRSARSTRATGVLILTDMFGGTPSNICALVPRRAPGRGRDRREPADADEGRASEGTGPASTSSRSWRATTGVGTSRWRATCSETASPRRAPREPSRAGLRDPEQARSRTCERRRPS